MHFLKSILVIFNLLILTNCNQITDFNKYKQYLSDKLGIESLLSQNKHKVHRRSVDENLDVDIKSHLLKIYSNYNSNQTKAYSSKFNIIRTIYGKSKCQIHNSSCLNAKLRTVLAKQREGHKSRSYVQLMELDEILIFDTKSINSRVESLSRSDLKLSFNFSKLLNKKTNSTRSLEKALQITVELTHGSNLRNKKFKVQINDLKSLNETKRVKLTLQQPMINFLNSNLKKKKFVQLNLKFKIRFKSFLKNFELNKNLRSVSDLLNKRALLTAYLKSNANTFLSSSDSIQSSEGLVDLKNEVQLIDLSEIKPNSDGCRKKPLTVNFKELGWDHLIIEPKFIKSYYCDGSCNMPLEDNSLASNHAILRALARRLDKFNLVLPKVCCTPAKLSSKPFLILDENGSLVFKKIDNIVVESCSCQ